MLCFQKTNSALIVNKNINDEEERISHPAPLEDKENHLPVEVYWEESHLLNIVSPKESSLQGSYSEQPLDFSLY